MKECERIARGCLSGHRLEHSIGTAKEARLLAERFGADEEKAFKAGMLHDIAKSYDARASVLAAQQYGVELDEYMLRNPALIHGPLAAAILRRDYSIEDDELLHAIAIHTTGDAGMSLMDTIIYTADLTEPGRDYKGIAEIREISRKDLKLAALQTLEYSIRYVLDRGLVLHPRSVAAYNYFVIEKEELR